MEEEKDAQVDCEEGREGCQQKLSYIEHRDVVAKIVGQEEAKAAKTAQNANDKGDFKLETVVGQIFISL